MMRAIFAGELPRCEGTSVGPATMMMMMMMMVVTPPLLDRGSSGFKCSK